MPASAPASSPAFSTSASSGRSASAAACRSLPSVGAEHLRVALAQRGEQRRRRPPARSAATAVAQPVELGGRPRGGQAAVGDARAPSARWWAGPARADRLAAAGAQRGAAEQQERHVGAERRRRPRPGRRGTGRCPRARRRRPARRRRRRCRRPGRPRAGCDLRRCSRACAGTPGVRGQRPRGPDGQVGLVERQRAGALALHGQREGVAGPGGELVEQADRVVDGVQLVEAVGPQRTDAPGAG